MFAHSWPQGLAKHSFTSEDQTEVSGSPLARVDTHTPEEALAAGNNAAIHLDYSKQLNEASTRCSTRTYTHKHTNTHSLRIPVHEHTHMLIQAHKHTHTHI